MDCKAILYYADGTLQGGIDRVCKEYISKATLPITSVTLEPMDFGRNFVSPTPKSYLTLFENILLGLENITDEIVFFCEADILYHPSHFEFTPERKDTFYYNGNYWLVRLSDGFAVHYDMHPLSGLCAYRESLLTHYKERVKYVKENGFSYNIGFEPFSHRRIKWKNHFNMELFYPPFPNLDLFHGNNLTRRKWAPEKFVNRPRFWEEGSVKSIPGWENLPELVESMKYEL